MFIQCVKRTQKDSKCTAEPLQQVMHEKTKSKT